MPLIELIRKRDLLFVLPHSVQKASRASLKGCREVFSYAVLAMPGFKE
jgi:hypothetical protein